MLQPGTLLNDRYRLIEPVGEGGMATVYRALDTRLGRTVAVKVLHPEYVRDQPFVQRFQQEAEFAASLGAHPNVVAIYDIGEDGPLRYIVMELIEGRNLKELIRERAPFTVAEAFALGAQVASALDFAHKRGLIHRDVKPQNILVTPEGVAKVTDFGIARSVSTSQLTRTGMVIGTAHYFSPEQAQGHSVQPQSDIYSLGIILYEMLTAHLPFDADNPVAIAMQHLHSEPPSPWDFNPDLPARAVAVVMRALEKDPARRYRDAAEFAAALRAQIPATAGGTTTLTPIVEEPVERTVVMQRPAAVVTPATTVTRGPGTPIAPPPQNLMRRTLVALAILLALAAVAAAAYFATSNGFGAAGKATSTPTATATARPKKHKPTPTPTQIPVIVAPTATPPPPTNTVVPPTNTPVPPTKTAVPPTNTSVPPTNTPVPQATFQLTGATPTPTSEG